MSRKWNCLWLHCTSWSSQSPGLEGAIAGTNRNTESPVSPSSPSWPSSHTSPSAPPVPPALASPATRKFQRQHHHHRRNLPRNPCCCCHRQPHNQRQLSCTSSDLRRSGHCRLSEVGSLQWGGGGGGGDPFYRKSHYMGPSPPTPVVEALGLPQQLKVLRSWRPCAQISLSSEAHKGGFQKITDPSILDPPGSIPKRPLNAVSAYTGPTTLPTPFSSQTLLKDLVLKPS